MGIWVEECLCQDRHEKGCCLALTPLSRSRVVQSTGKYGQTYLSDQNLTHTVNIGRCVGVEEERSNVGFGQG